MPTLWPHWLTGAEGIDQVRFACENFQLSSWHRNQEDGDYDSVINNASVADDAAFELILPSAIRLLVILSLPTMHTQYHDLTQVDAGGYPLTNNTRNTISCVYHMPHHIVLVFN